MTVKLPVANIQRFSTQDGPGVRTTVFFKGCSLRCVWCHNPEMLRERTEILYTPQNCMACGACAAACNTKAHSFDEAGLHLFDSARCGGCFACVGICPAIEPVGERQTVDQIMECIRRDEAFYGTTGGVTLSGGEPLLYMDGCLEILRRSKKLGYSTVVDTSGHFDLPVSDELIRLTDLFLWDYKLTDPNKHKAYTGVSNDGILRNLIMMDKKGAVTRLRCIVIKGINTETAHWHGVAEVYRSLRHCTGIDLIPYHPYGNSKNKRLGYGETDKTEWMPDEGDITAAKTALGIYQ
jgi:pyruvate formate lyase activating enzyme